MKEATVALEENLWSLWSHFGRGPGCELINDDGIIRFDTPIPTLPYNAVIKFDREENVDEVLDEIFEHYARRGVPFMWILTPNAKPVDLDVRLRARGFSEIDLCPGMICELEKLPSDFKTKYDDIEIRPVTDREAEEMYELITWRWEVPAESIEPAKEMFRVFNTGKPDASVKVWVAWKGGVPVAKAVIHIAAGVAGLHGVVTRPEARKLGLARNLTLAAFDDARRSGMTMGVLHSSPQAESLYSAMGFESAGMFILFAATGFHV